MSLFGIGAVPVFNAVAGLIGTHQQNKANSAANAQMIEWERERAKNAHQWEVEDLRKAGLNPILSAGGSGASTSGVSVIPSGASPVGGAINGAVAGMTLQEQLKGLKEDNYIKQQTSDNMFDLMHYKERVLDENGKPHFVEHNLLAEDLKMRIASTALQNALFAERIKAEEHANYMRSFERDAYSSDYGKLLWNIEKGLSIASKGASVVYGVGRGFSNPKSYINNYNWETGGRNYFGY